MLRPAADLPDSLVGLLPALAGDLDQVDQESPVVVIWRVAALVPAPAQVDEGPVGVELELVRRRIADPDRPGAPVAIELEEDLGQAPFAADSVHDLELVGAAGGAALHEAAETVGLVDESDLGQRAAAQAGVPDPAVAVVPVPLAAGRLGQRGGGGGRDGPGGRVRQTLQDQRGADDVRTVRARQLHLAGPAPPPAERLLEPGVEVFRLGRPRELELQLLGADELDGEAEALLLADADLFQEAVVRGVHLEIPVSNQEQAIVAADRAVDAGGLMADPGPDLAVVEARRHLDQELHLAANSLDDPDQLLLGLQRSARAHYEEVDDASFGALCPEGGAEHERALQVGLEGCRVLVLGRHLAVAAALPVEEAPEHAGGVDAGHAAPVDRARAADEGHRMAIADECVVADRRIRLLDHCPY